MKKTLDDFKTGFQSEFDAYFEEGENDFYLTFHANGDRFIRFKIHVTVEREDFIKADIFFPNMDVTRFSLDSIDKLESLMEFKTKMELLLKEGYVATYRSTGIDFRCINDGVPRIFNEVIGLVDKEFGLFDIIPSFRTAVFYIVIKSDTGYRERLSRFMNEVISTGSKDIITRFIKNKKGDISKGTKKVDLPEHLLKRPWDTSFSAVDNSGRISYVIYNFDDSKIDLFQAANNMILLMNMHGDFEIGTDTAEKIRKITVEAIKNLVEQDVFGDDWLAVIADEKQTSTTAG
jgi:hypothetical protein